MRKKISLMLMILLFLTACSPSKYSNKDAHFLHDSLLKELKENKSKQDKTLPFSYHIEVEEDDYLLTIKNAETVMYEVQAIAIDNDFNESSYGLSKEGLNVPTHMIPFQEDTSKNIVSSIVLDGTSKQEELYVMVVWKSYSKLDTFKVIFTVPLFNK